MSARRTPGPWRVERTRDHQASYRVMDVQEVTIALAYQQPFDTWRAKDNAHLLASAPGLRAALVAVRRRLVDLTTLSHEDAERERVDLEKLITRALGQD